MQAVSARVRSNQAAPHPRLAETVQRHLSVPYQRTPSDAGRHAFESVSARLAEAPFLLDAGCGTGASAFVLASLHRNELVLGVDKSAARLAIGQRRAAGGPENLVLLQCELVDFWQLAAAAGLRCTRQYLLYPNPWPKGEHLMRRWHAHPVLPCIVALGGEIELRTNWRVYAEEFALALELAGAHSAPRETFTAEEPLTPFERKYACSGHTLWRCRALLPDRGHDGALKRTL